MSTTKDPANSSTPEQKFNPGGRPKQFATPEELWAAACTYFEDCKNNPVPYMVCRYNKIYTSYKMQAMSVNGLCMHLDICNLDYYKKLPLYNNVMGRISNVIYVHNFTGAAAGLLKGRIISRTLRQK